VSLNSTILIYDTCALCLHTWYLFVKKVQSGVETGICWGWHRQLRSIKWFQIVLNLMLTFRCWSERCVDTSPVYVTRNSRHICHVFQSNVLSKPGLKAIFSYYTSHCSKHFSTVNFDHYVYCLLTFKKWGKDFNVYRIRNLYLWVSNHSVKPHGYWERLEFNDIKFVYAFIWLYELVSKHFISQSV